MPFRPSGNPKDPAYADWAKARQDEISATESSGHQPLLPAWLSSASGGISGVSAWLSDRDPVVTQGHEDASNLRDQTYNLMLQRAQRMHQPGYQPTPEEERLGSAWTRMQNAGEIVPLDDTTVVRLKNLSK